MTSDAQLLHFPASTVRPQGPAAGGVAGVNLGADAAVVFFGSADPGIDTVVATVSSSSSALAGADPGRAKVSSLAEFPGKGRATGGVRAHALPQGGGCARSGLGGAGTGARGRRGRRRAHPPGRQGEAGRIRHRPLDAVIGSIGETI